MSYTYVIGENSITLFNMTNGNKVTVFENDSRFDKFKEFIIAEQYDEAESLDVKAVVQKFGLASSSGLFGVYIADGVGVVQFNAQEYPLQDVIVKRILKMNSDGFSPLPLVNFLENLYSNPSKTAIDELFLFLEATDLPITKDGCFIAYKIVKHDYRDVYTGTISNHIGAVVSMPRFAVDDKRNNTCSSGLHFCSKSYLIHYGSSKQDTDRCVLVKINPKDVVSIPSDYNNAKGRTCQYEVVGEMASDDWRTVLSQRDYTDDSVVDEYGDEYEEEDYDEESFDVDEEEFFFDRETELWRDSITLEFVNRQTVMETKGISLEQVIDLESYALSRR